MGLRNTGKRVSSRPAATATPRALELRERVNHLVQEVEAVLRPVEALDLKELVRTFTLRTSEGFVETFGPNLSARVSREAPGVRLRFMQKADRESASLRDGSVDLETGVIGNTTSPEFRVQALFRDRFIGVVRAGHSLCQGEMTPARYAAGKHVAVPRRSVDRGPIDEALKPFGLEREIGTVVGGFSTAVALARASDLIASVPEPHTEGLRVGLHSFPLPMPARGSLSRCIGTPEWMATLRTAGCAAASAMFARGPVPRTRLEA